jgi:hypothetical protein
MAGFLCADGGSKLNCCADLRWRGQNRSLRGWSHDRCMPRRAGTGPSLQNAPRSPITTADIAQPHASSAVVNSPRLITQILRFHDSLKLMRMPAIAVAEARRLTQRAACFLETSSFIEQIRRSPQTGPRYSDKSYACRRRVGRLRLGLVALPLFNRPRA